MKRALTVTALLAMGCLVAPPPAAAQFALAGSSTRVSPCLSPATAGTTGGQVTVGVLGSEDVSSSKFEEYRDVAEGVSVPCFNLFSTNEKIDFNLFGFNVSRTDQRYLGWFNTSFFDLGVDYNQTPHNMGNGGRSIFAESAPGEWTMSDTLQQELQRANDAQLPTSTRTYAFYSNLLAPTFASAGTYDVSSRRKRGTVALDLGKKLPIDLTLTYMRELKEGYRGEGGGNIRGAVNPSYEVLNPLDEVTEDYGIRAAYNFKAGNVHASFNRNLYDNKVDSLTVDNPFQAVDSLVLPASGALPVRGGPARDRIVMAPDNEASTGGAGFLLKLARQTRISGDVSLASWTQNAPFYPYTANTAVLTPSGTPAASLAALPQSSYDGKWDRTLWNFTFTSRPAKGLGLRAQYRSYELEDKSGRWVSTGDMSTPHQNWNTVVPSAAAPYGRLTANPYDTKTSRFTASASYDIGGLTLEGAYHNVELTRRFREATSGTDEGITLSAVFRARDWLDVRASYGESERTAEGETLYGFTADEAEREMKRTRIQADVTPLSNVVLSLAYMRRDVEYTNRPDRIAVTSGAPTPGAQPIPGTPSGLLEAKYDSWTAEVAYAPSDKFELGAYYTWEQDDTVNQFHTTTGVNLNNSLRYAGTDETDTFGLNGVFQQPDKWRLHVNAMRQKVNGLMDITAREAGSFYTPGRTTLIPSGQGGAADIDDWDDTTLTTFAAEFGYTLAKAWELSAGYVYEKYDFKDAFAATDLLMPQAVYIFMKPDRGAYNANVLYGRLSYRF